MARIRERLTSSDAPAMTGEHLDRTDLLNGLHGDPERPALDAGNLKPFSSRLRGEQPTVGTSSEALVAQVRGRAPA